MAQVLLVVSREDPSLLERFVKEFEAVEAVTVSDSAPSLSMLPIRSAAERPTGVNDIWRKAVRRRSATSGISI